MQKDEFNQLKKLGLLCIAFGVLLLITGFFSYEVFITEDKIQEKMIDMMV